MKKNTLSFLVIVCLLSGCSSPDWEAWKAGQLARFSRRAQEASVGSYEKALRALPQGPKRDLLAFKLGDLYLRIGEYPKAIEQFRSLETDRARSRLAIALFKDSDYTGALDVFNRAGESGSAEYLYAYGMTLEKNNLYDQALRVYSLIKNDPVFFRKAEERIDAISLISHPVAFSGVDEEVKKIVQESPGLEAYKEASALYLLIDERVTMTEDLRLITEFHYVIKILNDRGKEKFGEVSLSYDSTYEKLELEYARTIRPDGAVVTVGDKNIRDVSMYLNFPLYSNARVRIASMPEVASGSVIEYKGRIVRSQLPNKKDFNSIYTLATDEPVMLQRFSLSVPENKELRHKIVNAEYNTQGFDMNPRARTEGGRRIYEMEFKDVAQIIPEPGMPPASKINPYILFSTFSSWQDIYAWWESLYRDKIVAGDEIKAKVAELTKGKATAEEKARAIYNFCAQEIRYVAVEYGDAGYEPHHAAEIFKNKYGDCKDKAILLISMLKAAGIDAFPVLISTEDATDVQEDLPGIMFNHAIAVVKVGEKPLFMDATGMTVSFGDLPAMDEDRLTLVFYADRYELVKTPLFGPEHNKISTQMRMKIGPDESIAVERIVRTSGNFEQAQRFWLKFTMPALIEEGLKQKVRGIADGAELKEFRIENVDDMDKPVLLQYRFTAPQYFTKADRTRVMPRLSGVDDSLVVKDTRRYPIDLSILNRQEETIEVELPAHLAVKYLPSAVESDNKWFRFVNTYERVGKNVLRFTSVSETKQKTVSVAEYPEYKRVIEALANQVNQQVVFEEIR